MISISASSYPLLSTVDAATKPIVALRIMPSGSTVRRPYHLVMLLDVSGSMDGERMTALRRTLNLLVDALRDDDILTLITYNSSASIRADCVSISTESRTTLHTIIDGFRADGGTNMEAAIGALLALSGDATKPNIDAIFILTDGHINGGMTSSAGLIRLLQAQIYSGIPINTLGYGADHNCRLLRDMALRSRGTYTYADANEMLPAIIGDLMGGLEAEVGRQAKLIIPDGWTCLEIPAPETREFSIGTLIADKVQWIVLEGAAGTTSIPPLECTWTNTSGAMQSVTCSVDASIPVLEVVEQRERCRVANTFAAVTEDVEGYRLDIAREKLSTLSKDLATSFAKDTTFVIRLAAQVDDMIDSLKPVPPAHMPPMAPGGLGRSPAGFFEAAPSVAPMVSRLASGTAVLGNQRGIMSSGVSGGGPALFSSPSQRSATTRMTTAYSQSSPDPTDTAAATAAPVPPTLTSTASTVAAPPPPESNTFIPSPLTPPA
jgi:Mg-chelatase subunit ChlD